MTDKIILVVQNLVFVVASIIMVAAVGLLLFWTASQVFQLAKEILPEPKPYKSSAQINAEKRDECLANGFGYEFVNEFFYTGVRCKDALTK